jgi:hypothetical protein
LLSPRLPINEWWKGELTDELDFGVLEAEWAAQHATRCARGYEAGAQTD